MYRRWKESKGKDKEYENIIRSVLRHFHQVRDPDPIVPV
jgi:hypothetical protein